MKYFEYPEKGTGTGRAYCNDQTLSLDLGSITFDWANMLDTYDRNGNYSDAERKAVSQLMVACGYSVNMYYGIDGSVGGFIDIVTALINNFNYDAGTRPACRDDYSRKNWEYLIYNNLANIGPLYYGGDSTESGHAFVCDGYSTDGFFHFNWGWGGSHDGYFTLQALNPYGYGIEEIAGGYNYEQVAIIGIQRPIGSTSTILPQLTSPDGMTCEYSDGMATITGWFVNLTGSNINIDTYVKFSPVNGGEDIRYCAKKSTILFQAEGFSTLSVPINSVNLPDGTYNVTIETTATNNTETYYPLLFSYSSYAHITLTKEGTSYTVSNDTNDSNDKGGKASITFSELFSELYYDSSTNRINVNPSVSYTIKNTSTQEAEGGLAFWIVDGKRILGYSTGTFYDLMPGESISEKKQLKLTLYDRPTIGKTYDLHMYDPNGPYILENSDKISTVTFVEYPGGATLTGSGLAIVGDPQAVNPAEISFSGNVLCTSGVFGNTIEAWILASDTFNDITRNHIAALNLKESESTTYSYTIRPDTALEPDTDYILAIEYLIVIGDKASSGEIERINFHTAKSSGIYDVTANQAENISITTDSATRTAAIRSTATISNVTVVGISGAAVNATVSYQGTSAVVAMEHLPAGIYVIHAIDADGNNNTSKVALR